MRRLAPGEPLRRGDIIGPRGAFRPGPLGRAWFEFQIFVDRLLRALGFHP